MTLRRSKRLITRLVRQLVTANANGETLWFPAGTYITSFPLISNCSQPITWKCESERSSVPFKSVSEVIFPIIMHEGHGYLNGITTQAAYPGDVARDRVGIVAELGSEFDSSTTT